MKEERLRPCLSTSVDLATPPVDESASGVRVSPNRDMKPIIDEIRETYRWRADLLKTEVGLTNRVHGVCRRLVGFNPFDEDEKAKKRQLTAAKLLYASVTKKDAPPQEHTDMASMVCLPILEARAAVKAQRMLPERRLEELAQKLPVWEWWGAVNGLGALGLAVIVSEAGDLSNYANPAKLWKRMGLAPGQRRSKNKEEAEAMGYSPRRRSAVWQIGDSLIKKQNEYRELYLTRKVYEAEQDSERSKMHNHRRAQRYMEKRVLLHLWQHWRAKSPADNHAEAAR